jgi:hypothetical protein
MPTMTADESRRIARLYAELASALADYRFSHWGELTRTQRAEIESHEWTLLTYSSNMATRAIRIAGDDSETALAGITRATRRLVAAVKRIASVKKAISLATTAVALGGAIASGHALAIGEAVSNALSVADG